MDPGIDDYIRENRDRYASDATGGQLIAAGPIP